MRLYVIFLLILVCADVSARLASNLTACFNPKLVHQYGRRNQSVDRGIAFKVFGITPFCYVYVGWLHNILDSAGNSVTEDSEIDTTSNACKDKLIVQMRTEGNQETVLLAVDRFGSRIRVQSAANGPVVNPNVNGMMWLKFAHNDRRQQIFTNNIEKGSVIQSIAKVRGRVFVICISMAKIKIYELKVYLEGNILKPYLKISDPITIMPDLVAPSIGLSTRSVQDLYINGRTVVPIEKINVTTRMKEYVGHKYEGIKTSGFVFYHTANIVTPMTNIAPALTFSSMIAGAVVDYQGYSFHDRFLYKSDNGKLIQVPLDSDCVAVMGAAALYKYVAKNDAIVESKQFRMHAPHTALHPMSKKPYLHSGAHRRMAYPHTFNHNQDRHILDIGWAESAPVLFGTLGAFTTVGTIVRVIMHMKDKKLHRKGVTTSLSNAYSL